MKNTTSLLQTVLINTKFIFIGFGVNYFLKKMIHINLICSMVVKLYITEIAEAFPLIKL